MNIRLITNLYLIIAYQNRPVVWNVEAKEMINNNVLPDRVNRWLKEEGFNWPMSEEQEVEFKLRFMY